MAVDEKPKPNPFGDEEYPLSPKMEKEREKTNIRIPVKHMVPRIIAFIILLGGGISLIVLSVLGVFSQQSGIQVISVNEDPDYKVGENITLRYYLSGNSIQRRNQASAVAEDYSRSMKSIGKLLEDEEEVVGVKSISYISRNAGTEVEIDEILYKTLSSAVENSKNPAYSIYLGPLYQRWNFWTSVPESTKPTVDPLYNAPGATFISEYLNLLASGDNIKLNLLGNNKVKLELSQAYRSWLEDNEYDGPILSLGSLKQAYQVQVARDALIEKGHTAGVLVSEDGLVAPLGELIDTNYRLYAYENQLGADVGSVKPSKPKASLSFVYQSPNPTYQHAYRIQDQTKWLSRNLNIVPTTGYGANYVSDLCLMRETDDLVKLRLDSLAYAQKQSSAELESALSGNEMFYSLASENSTIHASKAFQQQLDVTNQDCSVIYHP